MLIKENVKSAIKSLRANKNRSILTILGIVVGITAVVILNSIGRGFEVAISKEINNFGQKSIDIFINDAYEVKPQDYFNERDIDNILQFNEISAVTKVLTGWSVYYEKNDKERKQIILNGGNEDYFEVEGIKLLYGRYVNDKDDNRKNMVMSIDNEMAKEIFGKEDVIGEKQELIIKGEKYKFEIIGVFKKAFSGSGIINIESAYAVVPYSILQAIYDIEKIDTIRIKIQTNNSTAIGEKIINLLEVSHKNKKKYRMRDISTQINGIKQAFAAITIFVSFVAAISLIVGGIGIMNIMLVSVIERTKEIGIRKSIGAKNQDILIQFLVESVFLTVTGGIIGLVMGILLGMLLGSLIKINPIIEYSAVIFVFFITSVIGIIFGIYPAYKASKLSPIEALRYE